MVILRIHGRYSFAQGQTIRDCLVSHSSGAGTRYVNQRDNEQTNVEVLYDLSIDIESDSREVGLGPRENFYAATITET